MYTIIEHQTCIYLCIGTIEYIIAYNMCKMVQLLIRPILEFQSILYGLYTFSIFVMTFEEIFYVLGYCIYSILVIKTYTHTNCFRCNNLKLLNKSYLY